MDFIFFIIDCDMTKRPPAIGGGRLSFIYISL